MISDNESNCDDFDNSDNGRSNTTIPSLDELLTDKGLNAAPGATGDNDASEPVPTGPLYLNRHTWPTN